MGENFREFPDPTPSPSNPPPCPSPPAVLLVIGINVVVGLLQEGKAEKAASAISNMLAPTATVTRGGETEEIDASELVVGDIVHLKAGDKVPADLRVLNSAELKVSLPSGEAALTCCGQGHHTTRRRSQASEFFDSCPPASEHITPRARGLHSAAPQLRVPAHPFL